MRERESVLDFRITSVFWLGFAGLGLFGSDWIGLD